MPKRKTHRVVLQPAVYAGMQRGINQVVDAIRPTLGPHARTVAIASIDGVRQPELLDNGGVIARRIIQLPDRDEDVGAMFVRQMLWQLQEDAGDGTATAAVLFQSIFNEGVRYIAAGGNAMRLRSYLEKALRVVLEVLDRLTIRVEGQKSLTRVAQSISHDADLAIILGEIFDLLGEYGRLEIQSGHSRQLEHDYVEGVYWMNSGVFSAAMINDHASQSVELKNAAVCISDLEIDEPQELEGVVRAALQAKAQTLVIVARKLSEKVIGFLLTNKQTDKFHAIAVKTPGLTVEDQMMAMEDLGILTGGSPRLRAAGQTFAGITPTDLGWTRLTWATRFNLGIVEGKGNQNLLHRKIEILRDSLYKVSDIALQKMIRERIGRLKGGAATLRIGGATETEIKFRKEVAQRTSDALHGAVTDGVVPGGGTALLACCISLQSRHDSSNDDDERAAYRILLSALRQPFRTILLNAGYDPGEIMAEVTKSSCGFDVETGQVVDMRQAGIFDVALVQKAAVKAAVSSAALALTIDVMVHRKRQREARMPHLEAHK